MPNQISKLKQRLSITMSKDLVKRIDRIAELTDRDRTYIIQALVKEQLTLLEQELIPDNGDSKEKDDKTS